MNTPFEPVGIVAGP